MKKPPIFFLFFIALLAAGSYFFFVLDVGGQTLASHAQDVWHAKITQDKYYFISHHLNLKMEKQLRVLNGERPQPFKEVSLEPFKEPIKEQFKELPALPQQTIKKALQHHDAQIEDKKSLNDIISSSP